MLALSLVSEILQVATDIPGEGGGGIVRYGRSFTPPYANTCTDPLSVPTAAIPGAMSTTRALPSFASFQGDGNVIDGESIFRGFDNGRRLSVHNKNKSITSNR